MFDLTTDRLRLREWRPEDPTDVDALLAILSHRETLKLWPFVFDREGVEDWIGHAIDCYRDPGYGRVAVELRDTGEVIGDCGLNPSAIDDWSFVDLGWIFHVRHHGNGYAIEAARAIAGHAFNTLHLPELIAHMAEEHHASRRVAERLGMTYSHTQPYARNLNKPHTFFRLTNT